MDKKTQKEKIRKHLMDGKSITPLHALNEYGCFRLAAIVFRLRQEGMDIITENVSQHGKTFALYRLAS